MVFNNDIKKIIMIIFLFIINDRVNTGKMDFEEFKNIWGPKLIQYSQNPNKIQQFLIENINDLNFEKFKDSIYQGYNILKLALPDS